ncbi:MAG: hypothetical protein RMN53_16755 [Anaerolineae bacterium]|nr:hypothetical protein [Anaerolineae bacterium]
MTVHVVLAGRIEQALGDLERVVTRAEELLHKAQQYSDEGYLDGVALNLHGFYTGAERIFEDIARTLDETVPAGPDWHRDLLLQMSAAIEGVRPAAISPETRFCLDEYRGFRHVVRNVYTFNLRPLRIQELTQNLRACYQRLNAELRDFALFLRALDRSEP